MFFKEATRGIKGTASFHPFSLFDVNPLSGHRKLRRIHDPNEAMREIHKRLIGWIRNKKLKMPNATGGLPKMSPLVNVRRHRLKSVIVRTKHGRGAFSFRRHFFLLDISSAYQAVDLEKLSTILLAISLEDKRELPTIREFLRKYCMSETEGGLVVGAPASPDLFNVYCEWLIDEKLRVLCKKYDLVYSRYLDDITFSSAYDVIGFRKRHALRKIIRDAGFELSDKKTQVLDLKHGPVAINGVGITWNGRMFLPRHALRELRELLRLAVVDGEPVDESAIHGRMGMFKHLTNLNHPNRTEQEIIRLYKKFRKMHGKVED